MIKTLIYAGPSLSHSTRHLIEERADELKTKIMPPAEAGSIWTAMAKHIDVDRIILIDGYFYTKLAVLHRELLDAINSGIKIIGCSSMGALRAVELNKYGLSGFGAVYEYLKRNPMTADDEVALLHQYAPDYSHLSIPLVNLRLLLVDLNEQSSPHAESVAQVIEGLANIDFTQRTWTKVEQLYAEEYGREYANKFTIMLKNMIYFDYKTNDADNLLESLILNGCDQKVLTQDARSDDAPDKIEIYNNNHGIDSSFIPINFEDNDDSFKSIVSIQCYMSSLRLLGSIDKHNLYKAIYKQQILALYKNIDTPRGYQKSVEDYLFRAYQCASINELASKLSLSKFRIEQIIKYEALVNYYIRVKQDEIGEFKINDMLFDEEILSGLYIKNRGTNIVEIDKLRELALSCHQLANTLGLSTAIKIFASLFNVSIKSLCKRSFLTRPGRLISLLSIIINS